MLFNKALRIFVTVCPSGKVLSIIPRFVNWKAIGEHGAWGIGQGA